MQTCALSFMFYIIMCTYVFLYSMAFLCSNYLFSITCLFYRALYTLVNHFFIYLSNLTKVRPLFTLSHRGSDNFRLLIVFSANNIDQSIGYFYSTESRLNDFVILKNNALHLKYAIWLVEIMMQCDWK